MQLASKSSNATPQAKRPRKPSVKTSVCHASQQLLLGKDVLRDPQELDVALTQVSVVSIGVPLKKTRKLHQEKNSAVGVRRSVPLGGNVDATEASSENKSKEGVRSGHEESSDTTIAHVFETADTHASKLYARSPPSSSIGINSKNTRHAKIC